MKKMKRYGFNQATEFTRKQINVVYAASKRNDLKVEKWLMSELYDLAEYYGYDDNGGVEFRERFVLNLLKNVFENKYEEAQEIINQITEFWFDNKSEKNKAKCNREMIA